MKGIVLVLLSVLVLSCEPIKDGYVISKWYEEENYYSTTEVKYVLTLKGKYEPVTTVDIAKDELKIPIERIHSGTTRRIGRILSEIGWLRSRETTGSRKWIYTPPSMPNAEGEAWEE